jgi:hypothetical protein
MIDRVRDLGFASPKLSLLRIVLEDVTAKGVRKQVYKFVGERDEFACYEIVATIGDSKEEAKG